MLDDLLNVNISGKTSAFIPIGKLQWRQLTSSCSRHNLPNGFRFKWKLFLDQDEAKAKVFDNQGAHRWIYWWQIGYMFMIRTVYSKLMESQLLNSLNLPSVVLDKIGSLCVLTFVSTVTGIRNWKNCTFWGHFIEVQTFQIEAWGIETKQWQW